MLYLSSKEELNSKEKEEPKEQSNSVQLEEDEVDKILEKTDGWVERKKEDRYCKHGPNGKCLFCMPIAPWSILEHDPWKSDGVKFLPFHSYIRKMQQATPNANKQESKPVFMPSYKVKECSKHAPWPEGICSLCQPSAIRVDSQPYRHVDHVEFQSMEMVNHFIQFWRETANQRVGFLYGKFIPHDNIPLGIKAQVMAIYEPPQRSLKEESVLEEDPNEEKIDQLAKSMGMEKIGFIWTDLILDSKTKKPLGRDLLLTSSEVVRAAKMQNKHPSVCKQSMNGTMGSKFVSVLVKANKEGTIEVEAFQVSDQCMSMVRDSIATVSKSANMLRVKKSKKNFVPDVFYSDLNEYKISVIKKAAPTVPTEFFIVPLGHGAAKDPSKATFKRNEFPLENRGKDGNKNTVSSQLSKYSNLSDSFSDFHLLVNLATKLSPEEIQVLAQFLSGDKQLESQVQQIKERLVKEGAAAPKPQTSQPSSTNAPTSSASSTGSNPQEKELLKKLMDLGIGEAAARESLFATNYVGVDAALDFLYS
eukprot:TRINITY_DN2106_c0_g1_i2.p1 TRINITY_DN2106_c0_g1~~TRINITY_DN2106_c0_g1_i2.p1  ORF type:complete len:613 (+),score=247.84 TRINITY_DN2106_c0_g1_i2:245-1840(+)